ncbi:unnamed protein product [Urochloa humidicola]
MGSMVVNKEMSSDRLPSGPPVGGAEDAALGRQASAASQAGQRGALAGCDTIRPLEGALVFRIELGPECKEKIILTRDLSRLFATYSDTHTPLGLELHDSRVLYVEVFMNQGGRSTIGLGWPVVRRALGLAPGDIGFFFTRCCGAPRVQARFFDPFGDERLAHPGVAAFPWNGESPSPAKKLATSRHA